MPLFFVQIVSMLTITNVTFVDTGNYTCNGSFSQLGRVSSALETLDVRIQGKNCYVLL